MTVEIHQPELEALIQQRMQSGAFQDVEEVLLYALKSAPVPKVSFKELSTRTGADILAAMQEMPYKDDIDIEPHRPHMPVRDVEPRENLAQFLLDSPLPGSGLEIE